MDEKKGFPWEPPEFLLSENMLEKVKAWIRKNKHEEIRNSEFKLVWMSPEEFLRKINHTFCGDPPTPVRDKRIRPASVRHLASFLLNEVAMSPLYILGGYVEGRNRAYAAWMLGVEKVPVLVG